MCDVTLVEANDRFVHLALSGRLDAPSIHAIELRFTAEATTRRRPLVIDFSGVTLIGSYGMGLLVTAARTLLPHNAGVAVFAPQPAVERALRGAAMDRVIAVVPDLPAALAAVRAA